MTQMISLFSILHLVFLAHCRLSYTCHDVEVHYGGMTEDKELKVGSPIELTCALYSLDIDIDGKRQHVNASYLAFVKQNGSYIDADKIQVISNRKSKLRIESSKVEDSGLYYCVLILGNSTLSVCASRVSIGDEPQNSSIDFRCFTNYQELVCKWRTEPSELKTNSILKENTSYKQEREKVDDLCICSGKGNAIRRYKICPNIIRGDNNTWLCKWTRTALPQYSFNSCAFEFFVETKNSLGTKSDVYHINHYEIALPPKPQKLIANYAAQNWIEILWESPEVMVDFPPGILYQIAYKSKRKLKWKVINITEHAKVIVHNITDLIPHTTYDITVRCRSPCAKGENMWSQNETIEVQTRPDVPYYSPNITKQAFEVKQSLHTRTIVIYWEHVPKDYWNGENFHYVITSHPTYTGKEKRVAPYKSDLMPYAIFDNVDPNSTYLFKIFSANSIGNSKSFSSIIVDNSENLLNVPLDISVILYLQGDYNISWTPPSASIESYTLFWCDEYNTSPPVCKKSIHWKHTTETSVLQNIPDVNSNIQFAVAANSGNSTSGMEWALCIVPYNGIPDKLQDFSVHTKNSTSLYVTWKLACNAQRSIIKEFHVIYCKVDFNNSNCIGPNELKQVPNSGSDYYIIDLVPSTWYRIYIRIIAHDDKEVDSEFKQQQTSAEDKSTGLTEAMIVSIIVGSAVGCAILLFIIYMFIRWMKKKYDLLKQIKVRLPTGLDTPNRCAPGTYQDFKKDLLQHYPYVDQIKQRPGSLMNAKKTRHGSGNSQYSNISADEFLVKKSNLCDKYRRNPSGDSSSGCSSNGGHDSVSSSNTNQTHVSTDSGTEIDFPSPSIVDNVFSEQSSIQKSIIFMMPEMETIDKCGSDPNSGGRLKLPFCHPSLEETKSAGYGLEKKLRIATCSSAMKPHPVLHPNYLQPYSKFGLNQMKDSWTNHCSRQCNMLAYANNLANSEPSVAELDTGNNDHFNPSSMPYSKLTFSKSLEDLHENSIGYSRCGIVEDSTLCEFSKYVKLPHYTTINICPNNERTENMNSAIPTKSGYVSIETCLENKSKMPECSKILSLNKNTNDVTSGNIGDNSMAYSKFDIKPSGVLPTNLRGNPKTGYIPIHQANCMLQTMNTSHATLCSPFVQTDSADRKLCLNNASLPTEIVVSAITEPCSEQCTINGLNSVPSDLCDNFFLCTNHIQDQENIPTSFSCDGTEIDENQNSTALNEKENTEHYLQHASLSDIDLNIHPEEPYKCGELPKNGEQAKTDKQTSIKSNYLRELEVVVSPRNLDYSTTFVPA